MREQQVVEKHIKLWHERGLISEDQVQALREASAVRQREAASRALHVAFALLGGGLLLAGLTLVVAENWEALHRSVKLAGWAVIHCGLLLGSWRLARRFPDRTYLSETLVAAAGGWVLAGIALVSQIYNLNARPPNGIWLWLVLVLPAAWLIERRSTALVVFAALTSALALEVADRSSWVWAPESASPWLFLAIPFLAAWAVSYLPRPLGTLRGWVGVWAFIVANVFLLVTGANGKELSESGLGRGWIVAGLGLAVALAQPGRVLARAWDATTARAIVLLSVLPWAVIGSGFDAGHLPDELGVGLTWLAQFAIAILMIRAGVRAGANGWVNLGYLAIVIGIVTRYFDFFGAYLEGGTALALTGVLILFLLYSAEKARRRTLARKEVAS